MAHPNPELRLLSRRGVPAWCVLFAALLLTGAVWRLLDQRESAAARREFDTLAGQIVADIEARLRQHEQILLGGAGLLDAQGEVSRTQWRRYVERLRLAENYPGIQGVGHTVPIAAADLARHIAGVRAEGFPNYTVRPPGDRPLYTSILYLEPFSERNLAAFGYDMYSEPTRRKAMDAAIDTGRTTISAKVKLVQETHGKPQAGFLMYVPVFRGATGSAEARRANWRGMVYSPYRMHDLMRGILGQRKALLRYTIHDGTSREDEALMFDSVDEHGADPLHVPANVVVRTIEAYGHAWTVTLESRPGFELQFRSIAGSLLPPVGIAFALALFALTWSLTTRRERAIALADEMTQRIRENEARLSILNERLNMACDFAGIAVWELLPETGEAICNDQTYIMYGLPRGSEVNLDTWAGRLHEEDRAEAMDKVTEALATGGHLDTRYRIVIPGQGIRYLKADARVFVDPEGRQRMIGVNLDITGQIQAQEAIAEAAAQNAAIVDNAVDGIITIDARGVIQSANCSALGIFGYRAEEVLGRNVSMLMPEPHRSAHDEYLARYGRTGERRIIGMGREVTGQRADGSIFPLELSVSEARHRGSPLYIGMVRDITERKRTERMKNEFVSTVSHELRTPLTSISGALGLIASGALGEPSAAARPLLEIAQRNAEQLRRLIDDLLDMEKIEAGKIEFRLSAQPVMPLLAETLRSVASLAERSQVLIELDAPETDIQVHVDGGRLTQILANFLSNAIKFSPPGGKIEVTAKRDGPRLRISVRDHGPGVPEDFQPRLFEKFSQADSSDTRQKGGTGLGLAISRELAQRMHGVVGYAPAPGGGACFFIELPLDGPTGA